MKLEINSSSLQNFFNDSFYNRNGFEMIDDEVEKMLRIGVKLAQEGNRADARHLLLRVVEAEPKNETAWLWLASISEYPEELLIFLQNVLKINPENERAIEWSKATKSLLAKTFVQRGIEASQNSQADFAKQCFLQAIYYDESNEMAWLWRASITEDIEEKILHLQKVLSFNPENETALSSIKTLSKESFQSLLRKANSAAISGDRETAGLLLEEVMQDAPEFEEAWILKAYLANDFYEKLGCYEKVLELNPHNEAAQAGMSSLKILMEKVENQPVISYQNDELSSGADHENFQTETKNSEVPDDSENVVEFIQETSETDTSNGNFNSEFSEQYAAEESAQDESYSLAETGELEAPLSEADNSADYVINGSHIADSEIKSYEENPVVEDSQNQQELEEIKLENFDFDKLESEIELVEFRDEEIDKFSDIPDAEFSLNVEENSENAEEDSDVYLIDDTQILDSYSFDFAENEEKVHLLSDESKEDVFEINEQSTGELKPESAEFCELSESFETKNGETASTNEYFGNYDQPTVESSYGEQTFSTTSEPAAEFSENLFEQEDESVVENFKSEETPNFYPETENIAAEVQIQQHLNCPFCSSNNEMQAISCNSCKAILSLSDLEMLLAHQDADREKLAQTIETIEAEKGVRDLNEDEFRLLGIAHLNAKNLRKGLTSLQEASKLNPNDVVLGSKVNFLAIRLSEIEAQENKNQENSSVSRMIMVVDDSPTVRKLISGKLEKSGHVVITANDGVEALTKIGETVPDLVLLDISMPQMDGYQVCKLIRSNEATKDIPVVMISGKDGFFDKVRGKMAGSTGYITKPFGPETLMKTLEAYIN